MVLRSYKRGRTGLMSKIALAAIILTNDSCTIIHF